MSEDQTVERTGLAPSTTRQGRFPVRLLKNYRPRGKYDAIGYQKSAITVKDAAGRMVELEPARFVKGEEHPPFRAGTGFAGKVWAGTVISLPVEEAKAVVAARIAERADEITG